MFSVDGNWGPWEAWGTCSETCNTGTKNRIRECNNPPPRGSGVECEGNATSTAYCTVRRCGEAGKEM